MRRQFGPRPNVDSKIHCRRCDFKRDHEYHSGRITKNEEKALVILQCAVCLIQFQQWVPLSIFNKGGKAIVAHISQKGRV